MYSHSQPTQVKDAAKRGRGLSACGFEGEFQLGKTDNYAGYSEWDRKRMILQGTYILWKVSSR